MKAAWCVVPPLSYCCLSGVITDRDIFRSATR